MSGLVFNKTDNNQDIITRIKEYISKKPLKIIILTPCYGSQCHITYVTSLMNTMILFTSLGIEIFVEFCRNDSLVSRARNNLIAKAMHNKSITHMIFIDADITWNPVDILKLVLADKNIVGGVYPVKNYEWNKLTNQTNNITKEWIDKKNSSQLNGISNEEFIQHRMVRYNLNYINNTLEVVNNLTKVKHLATGFMMIRRDTIEKMTRAFPYTKYIDNVGFLQDDENEYAYALFDCGVEDGLYCSEDWLFCSRWNKMGGEVWVDITINLNHSGVEEFKGSYLASLM